MLNLFLMISGEKVNKMKIHQFEKKYDMDLRMHYYEFVPFDEPRNKSTETAIIPFLENKYGCNPGKTFEIYLSLLSPESDLLFQSPKKMSKRFDLSSPDTEVFYDPSSVGVNMLARMVSVLCSVLDIETYSNKSVRKTGAKLLEEYRPKDRGAIVFRKPTT